ncbi:uncharacterized protein isoform X2 [Choristoneura fumiferana]|uniref:uncharacterized protein isoform X2 n=1 Tax=Choristoneura fumiferana TaxID=7141 RepID=UPI003D15821A
MRWYVLLCVVLFNNAYGQQVWQLNSAITDLAVSPTDTVHCRLSTPGGATVYDGFGPCRVNIDRVTAEHNGVWTMNVIQPNNVLAEVQTFSAQVTTSGAKPTVTTQVQTNKPLVDLTCNVATSDVVTACVFRDPAGQVLQASQGVAEDRYSFIQSSQAGVQSCGIQINGPLTSDLGLWRCDMQTASDTYYGHLTVLCPWAMRDPDVAAAVVSEPTLTSDSYDIVAREGESVTMSCSVQSAIRYCYFRARNGTIFNARPGMSSPTLEYVGAGLDAGECSARFSQLLRTDSGAWSCHVGFPDNSDEQRVRLAVEIQEVFSATQYTEGHELVVSGIVRGSPAVNYCRFVRIDGLGFTSENVPTGYTDGSSLGHGVCKIQVAAPTILDHHPWTVVTQVSGHDEELSQSTQHTLTMPPSMLDDPNTRWWIYVLVTTSVVAIVLVVFSFKRNRRWAAERAYGMRNSMRNSMRKEPVHDEKPPLPA